MSTTRLPDAAARLQRLVSSRLRRSFAWGVHDCALWVADAAQAVTGQDPAADFRGRYSTEAGATRLLMRKLGGYLGDDMLGAIVAQRLGPEISPAMAQPGDAGLTEQAGRPMLAVCVGSQWLAPGPEGLEPVDAPSRAWSAACQQ